MNIKIGDFQITSDGTQFILSVKETKGEKAKAPGEVYYALRGYYGTFEGCLKEIPRHALLRSDVTTFEEVLSILYAHTRMISQYLEAAPTKSATASPSSLTVKRMQRTK